MSTYIVIPTGSVQAGAPLDQTLMTSIKTDLDFLNSNNTSAIDAGGAPLVINGSFEADVVGTTAPTGWTVVVGTGSTGTVTNASQEHGGQSFLINRDNVGGHTGATLTSTAFMNVSPLQSYCLNFGINRSSDSDRIIVSVLWYSSSQSSVGSTVVYDTVSFNSTDAGAWLAPSINNINPPSNAYYAKLFFNLGDVSSVPASASTIYLDGISMSPRIPLSVCNYFSNASGILTGGSWPTNYVVPQGAKCLRLRICDTLNSLYAECNVPVIGGVTFTVSYYQISGTGPFYVGIQNLTTNTVYSSNQNTDLGPLTMTTMPFAQAGYDSIAINY